MTDFQFDTNGAVAGVPGPGETARSVLIRKGQYVWSDLTPFTQGYIEALFASLPYGPSLIHPISGVRTFVRFCDLAPETLARIIADCEKWENGSAYREGISGESLWSARNSSGGVSGFPPLTVQLNDDGKVRFAQ